MLVQNEEDGNLYVKKSVRCYNPEIYINLQKCPVNNTPTLYGIYEGEQSVDAPGMNLILIEEYLVGSTIAECICERGVFSEEKTIDITTQLCRILTELHDRKPPIIHRDLKPSNIMLLPDGTVKLLDFNAAKLAEEGKNRDTVLLGTEGFAAPEQYGFRSLKIYKMLPAFAVYASLSFLFIFQIDSSDYADPVERCFFRAAFFLMMFMAAFFYGDYMGIRRHFPFMRSPKKIIRILGFIIAPLEIVCGAIFLLAMLILLLEMIRGY